jgi:predicted NBD/HSP70 family sugar kinase
VPSLRRIVCARVGIGLGARVNSRGSLSAGDAGAAGEATVDAAGAIEVSGVGSISAYVSARRRHGPTRSKVWGYAASRMPPPAESTGAPAWVSVIV